MKQTLTIEQMRHLSELGCSTRNASMCLIRDTEGNRHLSVHDEYCYEASYMNPIPVYTLADIIEMLPSNIEDSLFFYWLEMGKENEAGTIDEYAVEYRTNSGDTLYRVRKTGNLIDAAYETLCWCLKNKYIETNKTNDV